MQLQRGPSQTKRFKKSPNEPAGHGDDAGSEEDIHSEENINQDAKTLDDKDSVTEGNVSEDGSTAVAELTTTGKGTIVASAVCSGGFHAVAAAALQSGMATDI